jgi:hypothetical protein
VAGDPGSDLNKRVENKRVEMIMNAPVSPRLSAATLLLAAGLCAFASAAAAQPAAPAAPTQVSPLSVQAKPVAQLNKEVRSFVQAYALRSGKIDQLPRWRQAICVDVKGLVPDKAALLTARVEDVAKAVGLKVLATGCRSNIQIVFAAEPQALANTISEPYLGYHNKNEIAKVRTVSHPIQGWYATGTIGAAGATGLAFAGGTGQPSPASGTGSGMLLSHGPGSNDTNSAAWEGNYGQLGGVKLTMEVVDNPDDTGPTGCADSRFSSCMQSQFMNVIVIVDARAMEGKTFGAVTDYVAMLAMSQPRSLEGCNALPSVIDLMAKTACTDRDAPIGLTAADSAYLAGLYASDPEARTTSAVGDISSRMAKILIKAQGPAR